MLVVASRFANVDFDRVRGCVRLCARHGLPAVSLLSCWGGQGAGIFKCHRTGWVFEPTGVCLLSRFLVFANFQHAEHTAHFDTAKRAFARHHRHRVVR